VKFISTKLQDLLVLEPQIFEDKRGKFVKVFNHDFFVQHGLDIKIEETYYSISKKNVIRGMHLQIPPYEHSKLVYVAKGSILDVVVDLRKNSLSYGEYFKIELSENNAKILIIPKGFAHGFKTLEDNTKVVYMQTTVYSAEHDTGFKYDSFGFNWQIKDPLISERDLALTPLSEFHTPFGVDKSL